MRAFKPGKYVNAKFTEEQEQARKLWIRAQAYENEVCEALHFYPTIDRKVLHERLDVRLDDIERIREKAKELFEDVSESFTIASMTI